MIDRNRLIHKCMNIFKEEGIELTYEDAREITEEMITFWELFLENA